MPSSSLLLTESSPAVRGSVLSLLRIVVGFLFICHGASKLFGVLGGSMGSGKTAPIGTLIGVSGVIEFVCGVLLLVGLVTRVAAFLLSGEMAVAYFLRHIPHGPWPLLNRGELAVVYCFLMLYLAVAGGGPFSLDAVLAKRLRSAGRAPDRPYGPRSATVTSEPAM